MNAVADTPINAEQQLAEVKAITLRQVRATISPVCNQRSLLRTLTGFAVDMLLYLACIAAAVSTDVVWLKLLAGLGAGCAVAFLFVWAHDAAHGALFENRRTAEVLGTIAMLPSLNMYRLWAFGHNRVHHGFTSLSTIDWIWRPWTPEEYAARSPLQRKLYRIERTPWGCALHYLIHVWWSKMIRFNPGQTPKEQRRMRNNKLLTLAFAIVASALAFQFGGGIVGVISIVLLPFIVFNYFIALFIYLHHTHPDIPFFVEREQWSPAIGQLFCSTVVRFSWLMEKLTHNIMIHVPHHVNPHIPFYRLPQAYADIKQHYAQYIHEYQFSWRGMFDTFRRCKLFDYERQCWYGYDPALA
ncbi:MAG: fatty acid desaturase [Nevskiales bacterium]|nr:fatty acid desaturase [Nevskiales bacterium]